MIGEGREAGSPDIPKLEKTCPKLVMLLRSHEKPLEQSKLRDKGPSQGLKMKHY